MSAFHAKLIGDSRDKTRAETERGKAQKLMGKQPITRITVNHISKSRLRSDLYLPSTQKQRLQTHEYLTGLLETPPAHWNDLLSSSWLDLKIDNKTNEIEILAYWEPREWSKTIEFDSKKSRQHAVPERVEIGIFSNEPPAGLVEVKLAGYITLLGEDLKPKPTLFSFPSKNQASSTTYCAKWLEPTGLHPTIGLHIDSSIPPEGANECQLYAHFTIPREIFPDRYQFEDELFMASKNLSSVVYISKPVDLEAPQYLTASWGSHMIIELAPPNPADQAWTAEVPLHLRYLEPSESGYNTTELPTPVLFWGCVAEDMDKKNPFARTELQREQLLPQKNVFFQLQPEEGLDNYLPIEVPVLSTKYAREVEVGTAVVIALGFGWVLWKALGVWFRTGYGGGSGRVEAVKKEQ